MKIILVDDHKILREGLKGLIEKEIDLSVIAESSDGEEVLNLVEKFHPDLIIMDVMMNKINGITATQIIKQKFNNIKILALSMYNDPNLITEIIHAGAMGFLTKDCAFDELVQAIRAVYNGNTYIGVNLRESVSDFLIDNFSQKNLPNFRNQLSKREIEVLVLITTGKTNKETAKILHLSPNTIRCHRQNIMRKINASNVIELTKYAMLNGYINELGIAVKSNVPSNNGQPS